MANVLHRVTKEYRQSVNTPLYSVVDWIINPTLPDCASKHWVIEGDTVREMTAQEKAVVDASEAAAARAALMAHRENQVSAAVIAITSVLALETLTSQQRTSCQTYYGQLKAYVVAANPDAALPTAPADMPAAAVKLYQIILAALSR